jgi:hypothetical protein
MSLADNIIEDRETRGLGPGYQRLVSDLKSAHRFQLSDDFAAAADQIMQSPSPSILKSFQLARLPFRTCWIETRFGARAAFTNGRDLGEAYRRDISTVGILIKAEDEAGLKWRSHLGWRFRTGECSLSTLGMTFDMHENPKRTKVSPEQFDDGKRTPTEVDALWDIESRGIPFLSDYHREFFAAHGLEHADRVKEMTNLGLGDWMGETVFWVTAVALMNSRNVALIEAGPDLSKIAKSRRKHGRHEPLEYSVCKISPRIMARRASSGDGAGHANIRASFVIGHFKVRRSGIHWWSPHIRGSGPVGDVSKKTYLVT